MGRSGLWDWMPDISNRGTGDIVWDIFQLGAGAYLLDIEDDGSGISHSFYIDSICSGDKIVIRKMMNRL